MARKAYDADLTDKERVRLEPYFSKHHTYKFVHVTMYIAKTGFLADAGCRKNFEEMMMEKFQCPIDISEKLGKLANHPQVLGGREDICLVESLSKIS